MAKSSKIKLSIPDQRIMDLIEMLKANGTIRYNQEFCEALDMHKQNLVNVRTGNQHFTVEQITKACATYNINANWVHGLSEEVFNKQAQIRFISQGAAPVKTEGKQKRS